VTLIQLNPKNQHRPSAAQDRARRVRQGILDIVRAYDGGGLTLAEARGDIDDLIVEAINEGVADALRELSDD
jgi:hypothetical protein